NRPVIFNRWLGRACVFGIIAAIATPILIEVFKACPFPPCFYYNFVAITIILGVAVLVSIELAIIRAIGGKKGDTTNDGLVAADLLQHMGAGDQGREGQGGTGGDHSKQNTDKPQTRDTTENQTS
nr:hypothetical protein [Candidatus Sigynarchaeota archaeon]